MKKPGDTWSGVGITNNASGALTNADSLPTAAVWHNGTADGTVTVTVTNVSTGMYNWTCTLPLTYSAGDDLDLVFTATVGGVTDATVAKSDVITESRGLMGENSGLRNTAYTGANLTSYDLCLYDTAAHAATNDGVTGLAHKYHVANTFDMSGNLLTSVRTRVS